MCDTHTHNVKGRCEIANEVSATITNEFRHHWTSLRFVFVFCLTWQKPKKQNHTTTELMAKW